MDLLVFGFWFMALMLSVACLYGLVAWVFRFKDQDIRITDPKPNLVAEAGRLERERMAAEEAEHERKMRYFRR